MNQMNLSALDLNLLRVLNSLLADPSTVRVASRVGLSQSAVSAALGRLRLALNDPLFIRQGQHLVPTDFAQTLRRPLREMFEDLEVMLSGPDPFDPLTASDSFKIAGSDFFAEMLMPSLAVAMAARAPHLQVQLVDLVPDSYLAVLERSDVDLALIPQSPFPDWIEVQPLFRSAFVLIARQGNPALAGHEPGSTLPIDLFCDLAHVVFSPEGRLQAMGDAALAQLGRRRRVAMTVPVFSGVAATVAASDLVGLVPAPLAVHLAPRLGLATYLAPVPLPVPMICMAWHRRHSRNPAHRFARAVVAEILSPLGRPPKGC